MLQTIKQYYRYKTVKVILCILLLLVLISYFVVFFQKGVLFQNCFLRQLRTDETTHYQGQSQWGEISLAVQGRWGTDEKIRVQYNLPNGLQRVFYASLEGDKAYPEEYPVTIWDEQGNVIFEGSYLPSHAFLFDQNGEPDFSSNTQIFYSGMTIQENPFTADYQISNYHIVRVATGSAVQNRGDFGLLFVAILLSVLTAIDIKWPLFFFILSYRLDVKDPEPSEFYLSMQRVTWYLYPTIAIGFYLAAIFTTTS